MLYNDPICKVGVSAAVIVLSLALAFSTWVRTLIGFTLNYMYTTVEDWLGWRHRKVNYNSTAIKKFETERMKALENRDHARRLTEINSRRAASPGGMKQVSTWDVRRLANGPFSRFRSRKGPEGRESV